MLTALVPTNDFVNRLEPEQDYKKLYEDACKDVKKLYGMHYEVKQELDALRMKYKELDEEHWELLGRESELETQLAKLTANYMSAKCALESAERCIINMAMQLHGGGDDDA